MNTKINKGQFLGLDCGRSKTFVKDNQGWESRQAEEEPPGEEKARLCITVRYFHPEQCRGGLLQSSA